MPSKRRSNYQQVVKNKRANFARAPRQVPELPMNAPFYNGPTRFYSEKNELHTTTAVCVAEGPLSSDVTGTINIVIADNPSALGSNPNWTALQGVYDEYRILAVEMKYCPNDRYNRGVSVYTAPVYGVIDHDANTALTSYANAARYESCKQLSLDTPWTMIARMSEFSEATFLNTNGPVSRYYLKFYGTGLTASTNYGRIIYTYRVQFRGLGV